MPSVDEDSEIRMKAPGKNNLLSNYYFQGQELRTPSGSPFGSSRLVL